MTNLRIVLRDFEDHDDIILHGINADVFKHLLWYKTKSSESLTFFYFVLIQFLFLKQTFPI